MSPEEKAREQIDKMLVASGWVIQDYKALNLSAGIGVAVREVPLTTGPCDYLLLANRKPVGVVEAKKQGATLSGAADQTGRYASSLPDFLAALAPGKLPFLYESTGIETFFRDERDPDPRSRRVFSFHRPETLAQWGTESDTLRRRLTKMPAVHPLAISGMRACQVSMVEELETVVSVNLQRAARLRQSILRRAFTGELV